MTSPLANLVARVTGQAQQRLRPRLASRFEGAGLAGDGFQEVATEQIARAPATPIAAPGLPAATPQPPSAEPLSPVPPPISPPVSEPQPAMGQPDARTRPEDAPAPAQHVQAPRPPAPAIEQLLTWIEQEPAPEPAAGQAPPVPEADVQPPAPLLAPADRTDGPINRADPLDVPAEPSAPEASLRAQNPAASLAAKSQPAPPEIVIQIGRIDLRAPPTPAPSAQTARPRQQRPKGADLSDYLRSKGGKR